MRPIRTEMLLMLVLAGLLRVFVVTEHWLFCAAIYGIIRAVAAALFSAPTGEMLLGGVLGFLLAGLYFFALSRIRSTPLWWTVAVLGMGIALF